MTSIIISSATIYGAGSVVIEHDAIDGYEYCCAFDVRWSVLELVEHEMDQLGSIFLRTSSTFVPMAIVCRVIRAKRSSLEGSATKNRVLFYDF